MLAVPYVILFVFAGGGAGDAKLMGAVGAWLGFLDGAWVLFCVALSGVVLALGYAIARGKFQSLLAHLKQILFALSFLVSRRQSLDETRLMNPSKQDMLAMPYGVAILVGVIVAAGGKLLWPA